ncbi:MAG: hypothetical protein IJG68_01855 [Bacilli bacterium]|nr:hypothetical protein [Bacilli bacterium]
MGIKNLIKVNKLACDNIASLENAIRSAQIQNDKDKANFGNLCVALRGFRMVADATEALLINENVLKSDDGNFYQKVDETVEEHEQSGSNNN